MPDLSTELRNDAMRCNESTVEPAAAAENAGLIYVHDHQPGVTRKKAGMGFAYFGPEGEKICDQKTIQRIRKLAVPPAWTDVWITTSPRGHLQATGRDAKGRKQYRYHPRFRETMESTKYEHMLEFAEALPQIRRTVNEHLGLKGLPRDKVLAGVVYLLETTLIRVGNDSYAKENNSYGLTTLRNKHVSVNGSELRFHFKGKSGKTWKLQLRDRRVAKVVRACQDLPGQELFQYLDETGELRGVSSTDVNAYLKAITGRDITAKDFRTWYGTVLAALALQEFQSSDTKVAQKKAVKAAIERVAARLGNTPTICRKCYIHPELLQAHAEGQLLLEAKRRTEQELRDELPGLDPEEAAVLAFLQRRLQCTLKDKLSDSLAILQQTNSNQGKRKPKRPISVGPLERGCA
jgi:DNA topoisomerase I